MPTTPSELETVRRAINAALDSESDLGLRLALTVLETEYRRLYTRCAQLEAKLKLATDGLETLRTMAIEMQQP